MKLSSNQKYPNYPKPEEAIVIIPKNLQKIPPKPKIFYNKNFIFHNKMPKSGSTTLGIILKILSEKNNFRYVQLRTDESRGGFQKNDKTALREWYERAKDDQKLFLMKHNFPLDIYDVKENNPTYINVIRDPVTWFQSNYYFIRYGRTADNSTQADRYQKRGFKEQDRTMDINTCVETNHRECNNLKKFEYFKYIGGDFMVNFNYTRHRKVSLLKKGIANNDIDSMKTLNMLKEVLDQCKKSLTERFYTVGILEHFETTLKLFEKLMPEYFEGVSEVASSRIVAEESKKSASINVVKLTDENKEILRHDLLKYENDLYEFGKALFFQQVRDYLIF